MLDDIDELIQAEFAVTILVAKTHNLVHRITGDFLIVPSQYLFQLSYIQMTVIVCIMLKCDGRLYKILKND